MRIPVIKGVIDRRILVNFQVDPAVLAQQLPSPFRPKLHNGAAMAGICLIRLRDIRPRVMPALFGVSSENAAHRMAVEWDASDGMHEGVFIPRRDTSSRLNALLGGHIFPGEHHHARFKSIESGERYEVRMRSDDGATHVHIRAEVADELPAGSVFRSLTEASDFFEAGSLGYSATAAANSFDGLELRSFGWKTQPLRIQEVESSFFNDCSRFPPGSAQFDSALLMRNIHHEWHARESLCNCDK